MRDRIPILAVLAGLVALLLAHRGLTRRSSRPGRGRRRRRRVARDHRVADGANGLAIAVGLGLERDGSIEVDGGVFTPAAALSGGR